MDFVYDLHFQGHVSCEVLLLYATPDRNDLIKKPILNICGKLDVCGYGLCHVFREMIN